MNTSTQYNTALQPIRDIDIKVNVLDSDMQIIDEISGVVTQQPNISIDSNADIRRTATISMVIKPTQVPIGVQSFDTGTYWRAGNPYWFDKYIQIHIGIKDMVSGEIQWENQGIYLINTPSISYDATTSELSFSGVDLMAKFTGLRNGYLEGVPHQIKAGAKIDEVIRSIVREFGFANAIVRTPPINIVPNDINIDIGGTAYDLLTQLRDINPNWEMFFDTNGVFYFQQIPSSTPNETPLVDDVLWDRLGMGYSLDTSFEDVKNYVEVIGKTIEVNASASATISGNTLTLTLDRTFSDFYNTVSDLELMWKVGFVIGDLTDEPLLRENDLYALVIIDSENNRKEYVAPQGYGIWYENQAYFATITADSDSIVECGIGGYTQVRAIAFEDNPESPFYVGDVKSGEMTTNVGGSISWGNELNLLTTVTPTAYVNNIATLNVSPWVDFDSASVGESWRFYLDLSLASMIVYGLNLTAKGYTNTDLELLNDSGDNVSADYNNATYVLELGKSSSTEMTATLYYIAIPANNWQTPTTKIYSLPKFSNMVRWVCSGDEYDNIYTNDLAMQRAKYEIYLRARLHDTLNLTCVPLYWLDVNSLISYTLPNEIDKEPTLWLVKSITTDLSATGTQNINAIRFYPLYKESYQDNVEYLVDSNGNYIVDSSGNYISVNMEN